MLSYFTPSAFLSCNAKRAYHLQGQTPGLALSHPLHHHECQVRRDLARKARCKYAQFGHFPSKDRHEHGQNDCQKAVDGAAASVGLAEAGVVWVQKGLDKVVVGDSGEL